MNEFVNFAVNYKPEVQNTATDALSRYPIAERHLREYSETCSADEVKATFDGAVNQSENNETLTHVDIIDAQSEIVSRD